MYNWSIAAHTLPPIWKTAEVVPVPKKANIKELNDLRPVALTPIVTKCLEKLCVREIKKCSSPVQDQMQFAYRQKRSVDDALLVFLDNVYRHLETPRHYCRILFVDFSSAFNTIQPHIIISKLKEIGLHSDLIAWILDFLTCRPQYVKMRNVKYSKDDKLTESVMSNITHTNTGAPQGAVLSPILFTTYTNDCQLSLRDTHLIKFADDSTVQGLISSDEDETNYRDAITWFVEWCEKHYLLLNIKKTKEMIIDFREIKQPLSPLFINGEEVERVETYKYLGVTIDDRLSWNNHLDILTKKLNSRMYFLRRLKSFNIDKTLITLFYKAVIESLVTFAVTCLGGNADLADTDRIDRTIRKAGKICGGESDLFPDFALLYLLCCQRKVMSITKDETHPLWPQIRYSSLRDKRVIPFKCNRERYRNSFLPSAVKLL